MWKYLWNSTSKSNNSKQKQISPFHLSLFSGETVLWMEFDEAILVRPPSRDVLIGLFRRKAFCRLTPLVEALCSALLQQITISFISNLHCLHLVVATASGVNRCTFSLYTVFHKRIDSFSGGIWLKVVTLWTRCINYIR